MNEKKQENNLRLAVIMTIAVFCMGQIPGSIDAAISKISVAFNLSSTSGMYVTTVASIVSVAFSILLGFVAGKKIGYRPLILFCATLELLSAIFPFFTDNFVVLIILRGLFGVGFGGMQSMENTIATTLIPVERRASILGLGMFFGFGMNCILQFIGGVLAGYGWNYVFLNHVLLIIPYVIVLIGCAKLDFTMSESEEKAMTVGTGETNSGEKLQGPVYMMWILMMLVGVFIAPLLIGCSFLSEKIIDSTTVAGVVAVCFSVGCMVGGLAFPKMYKIFDRKAPSVFLVLLALGMVGSGIARSVVLLCVMIFVGGLGFSMTQSMAMAILGITTSPKKIALASALMMALFNLGMFLSSMFEELVGKITGDALYMPLYIGAVCMVLFAVFMLVVSPFGKKE